ncbi:MAG TPA: nicotinamide-nucleotide amidohydrolase family protein [Fimbriimonas sp.]|nr:nicotinamide-nucleotide amidohydrolase family protein [Fimbriimonas sp.]
MSHFVDDEQVISKLLFIAAEKRITIATAESCTAGALANAIGSTEGAGGVFIGAFVSYDKSFKTSVLQVPSSVLQRETAVSEVVAEAMAQGAMDASMADLTLAITGVAGPDPDDDGNPVGLVHIALVTNQGRKARKRLQLIAATPDIIKRSAVLEAVKLMTAAVENWERN